MAIRPSMSRILRLAGCAKSKAKFPQHRTMCTRTLEVSADALWSLDRSKWQPATRLYVQDPTDRSPSQSKGLLAYAGFQVKLYDKLDQQLSVAGVKLMCPRDLKVFCLHKECKNWCSDHGLCLSGVCLCSPRWTDTDCSKKK